jgi:23S rRNA (cytosine1962-C5)-methyltransferase
MPTLVVQPRSRLFHGHEWVYATDIKLRTGDPQPGEVVTLQDVRGKPLGSAIYNPKSQIIARRFSYRRQDLDADFFVRRIERACGRASTSTPPYAESCGASQMDCQASSWIATVIMS